MSTTNEVLATAQVAETISFGNGKYSDWMKSNYDLMQELLNIPANVAGKIAKQMGTDIGALMVGNATISIKSPNKDNKSSISENLKRKGVSLTFPLNIARSLEWIGEAGKNGISYKNTGWELAPELAKYVASFEAAS